MSDFDEFDDIDDFDFDDEVPSSGLVATVAKEVGSELLEPSIIKAALAAVLPKGFSEAFGNLHETYKGIESIYTDSSKEIDALKKSAGELAGAVSELGGDALPNMLKEKLDDFYQKHGATTFDPTAEEAIKDKVGSLFDSIKREQESKLDAAEEKIDKAKSDQLAGISGKLLGNVVTLLSDDARFRTDFTEMYYKKSLELAYRQTHYQRETFILTGKMHGEIRRIVHNTGLPDFVKAKHAQISEGEEDNRAGFISSALFGEAGFKGFKQNIGERFKERLTEMFKEKVEAGGGVFDSIAMMMGMAGMDKQGAKGMALAMPAMWALQKAGSKAQEYFKENHPELMEKGGLYSKAYNRLNSEEMQKRGALAEYLTGNLGGEAQRLIDLVAAGPDGMLKDIAIGLSDVGKAEVRTSFGLEDLSQPVPFTGYVHRSLVEVIPGLLSRLLRSSEGIRTGKLGDLVSYDFDKGIFSTETEIRKGYIEEALASEQRRVGEISEKAINEIIGEGEISVSARKTLKARIEKELASGVTSPNLQKLIDITEYSEEEMEAHPEIAELFASRLGVKERDIFAKQPESLTEILKEMKEGYLASSKEENQRKTALTKLFKEMDGRSGELNKRLLMESAGQSDLMRRMGLIDEQGRVVTENLHDLGAPETVTDTTFMGKMKAKFRGKGGEEKAAITGGSILELTRAMGEFATRLEKLPDGRTGDRLIDYYKQIGWASHLANQTELLTAMLSKLSTMNAVAVSGSSNPGSFINGEMTTWKALKQLTKKGVDILKIPFNIGMSSLTMFGKGMKAGVQGGYEIVTGAMGKAYREAKGILGIGKMGPTNVYLRGDLINPVLRKTAMQTGDAYFDKETGDPIKTWEDIKGAVVDKDGVELITAQDLTDGIYNSRFQLLNAKMLGLAGKFMKAGGAVTSFFMSPLGTVKELVTTTWRDLRKNQMTLDVYVVGDPKVRLLSKDLLRGRYFSLKTDKVITKYAQLYDGVYEVIDGTPRIIIDEEEAQDQGLVDFRGNQLEGRFVRLIKSPFRFGMKLLRAAGDVMGGAMAFGKKVGGGLWSLLTGGIGGLAGWISGKAPGKAVLGQGSLVETNDILTKIYNLLFNRFGDGSLDGITAAEQAKEKEQAKETKEEKEEKVGKDPASRVIKELNKINDNLDDVEEAIEENTEEVEDSGDDSLLETAEDLMDGDGKKKRRKGKKKPKLSARQLRKIRAARTAATVVETVAPRVATKVATRTVVTSVAAAGGLTIGGIAIAPLLAVAAAGLTIWQGYKYFVADKKLGQLGNLRIRAYGLNPASGYAEDYTDKIRSLEDDVIKDIVTEGGKYTFRSSLSPEDWASILSGFGISNKDKSKVVNFFNWLNGRFLPALLVFKKMADENDSDVQRIDSELEGKEAYAFAAKYIGALPRSIFQHQGDPISGGKLIYDYDTLLSMLKSMGGAAGMSEGEQAAATKKATKVDLTTKSIGIKIDKERQEKGLIPPIPKTTKRTINVGEASLTFTVNPNTTYYTAPLTIARFKAYGVTRGTKDQIDILAAMESDVFRFIKVMGKSIELDGMTINDIKEKYRALFAWPKPDTKKKDANSLFMSGLGGGVVSDPFDMWLSYRFMPVVKQFAFMISEKKLNCTLENAHIKMVPKDQIAIVRELQVLQHEGKLIWQHQYAPFPGMIATKDPIELKTEITTLEGKLKDDLSKSVIKAPPSHKVPEYRAPLLKAGTEYGKFGMEDAMQSLPGFGPAASPSAPAPRSEYVTAPATSIQGQPWNSENLDEDMWWIANNFYYEDRSDDTTDEDLAQIGHVVLNRVRFKWPGKINGEYRKAQSIKDVITSKSQFSWYSPGFTFPKQSPVAWERSKRVAREFLAGKYPNKVGSADHYYAAWMDTRKVRDKKGRVIGPPPWSSAAIKDYGVFGKHRFMALSDVKNYEEKFGGTMPEGVGTATSSDVNAAADVSLGGQSPTATSSEGSTTAPSAPGGTPPASIAAVGASSSPSNSAAPKISLGGQSATPSTPSPSPSMPSVPFEANPTVKPQVTTQAAQPTVKNETQTRETFSNETAQLIKQSNTYLGQISSNTARMVEILGKTESKGTPQASFQPNKQQPPVSMQ